MAGKTGQNRFNGFLRASKPLKRLACRKACATRLKPGVNESNGDVAHFYESQQDGSNGVAGFRLPVVAQFQL